MRSARPAVERRTRSMILSAVLIGLTALLPLSAAADLAPEVQADLYLVQTEDYL